MKKRVLTKKDILHLAALSKLLLSEKEIEKYLGQLEQTVEYVNNLNELPTKNIEPTSQTTNLTNVGFKDGEINKRKFSQQEATKNIKNKKNGFFVVKRIL